MIAQSSYYGENYSENILLFMKAKTTFQNFRGNKRT
jgi:hypothetical protein